MNPTNDPTYTIDNGVCVLVWIVMVDNVLPSRLEARALPEQPGFSIFGVTSAKPQQIDYKL